MNQQNYIKNISKPQKRKQPVSSNRKKDVIKYISSYGYIEDKKEDLARDIGVCRMTLFRHLRDLESDGYIKKIRVIDWPAGYAISWIGGHNA